MKPANFSEKIYRYRVPISRWGGLLRAFMILLLIAWLIFGVSIAATLVGTLIISRPTPILPPLTLTLAMLLLFTLITGVFGFLALIDPWVIEISEEGFVASCGLKTWHIRWQEVDRIGTAWLFPTFVSAADGYTFKYPVLVGFSRRRFAVGFLILFSLCLSGQDSEVVAELRRRVPKAISGDA